MANEIQEFGLKTVAWTAFWGSGQVQRARRPHLLPQWVGKVTTFGV